MVMMVVVVRFEMVLYHSA